MGYEFAMKIEKLKDNRINDFIDYCKKHRREVDDSFLYDEDLDNFNLNEGNKTYILMNDGNEEIIGAISIITNLNYIGEKKSRFRIFHSEINDIEVYDLMLKSILKDIKDVDRLFLFIKEEKDSMAEILKRLNFNIERYSYTLIRDDLDVLKPTFSQGFGIRPFIFGSDEEGWCEVNNEGFKSIHGSTIKTPEMIHNMAKNEEILEGMILLCHNENQVGQVIVSKEIEEDIAYAFISSLCVKPEYKGMGLGRNLLRAALSHGKSQGMTKGMLTVNGENKRALELYLKEGFRVDSTMVCYNYDVK